MRKTEQARAMQIMFTILNQETKRGTAKLTSKDISRILRVRYGITSWKKDKINRLRKQVTTSKGLTNFPGRETKDVKFIRETKRKPTLLRGGTKGFTMETTVSRWSQLSPREGALVLVETIHLDKGSMTTTDVNPLQGKFKASRKQITLWMSEAVRQGWMTEKGLIWQTTSSIPHDEAQPLLRKLAEPDAPVTIEQFLPANNPDVLLLKHIQQEQITREPSEKLAERLGVPERSLKRSIQALVKQGKLYNTAFVAGHGAGRGRFLSLEDLTPERALELTLRVAKDLPLLGTAVTSPEQIDNSMRLTIQAQFEDAIAEDLGGGPVAAEVASKHSTPAKTQVALQNVLADLPLVLDANGKAVNLPEVIRAMRETQKRKPVAPKPPPAAPVHYDWMGKQTLKLSL
ncbi:hypothetical protein ACN28S_29875 [Cystobacter fuscus]